MARDFVTVSIPPGGYSRANNKFLVKFPYVNVYGGNVSSKGESVEVSELPGTPPRGPHAYTALQVGGGHIRVCRALMEKYRADARHALMRRSYVWTGREWRPRATPTEGDTATVGSESQGSGETKLSEKENCAP